MKEPQKPSLKRNAISFFGVITIVVIVAIIYSLVDRPTALIVGGILAVILFAVDQVLKKSETKVESALPVKATQAKQESQSVPGKSAYTEKEIN
jgi:ABC-type transport system involved in cytochrome bd biosynthesis fused ATPase/permease subunit